MAFAKTRGAFLDTLVISLLTIICGALCWILINVVAGDSRLGMGILLFAATFVFSYIRARAPKYSFVGAIGPNLAFTACTSVLGLNGANTTGGNTFDANYLGSAVTAFLIGNAINLFVNLTVFPSSAAALLAAKIADSFDTVSLLTSETLKCYSLDVSGLASRNRSVLAKKLREQVAACEKLAPQVATELYWSKLGVDDFRTLLHRLDAVSSALSAIDTALVEHEEIVLCSPYFRENFQRVLQGTFDDVDRCVAQFSQDVAAEVGGRRSRSERRNSMSATHKSLEQIKESIEVIKSRQFEVLYGIFDGHRQLSFPRKLSKDINVDMGSIEEEGLWQVNFLCLGVVETLSIKFLTTVQVQRLTSRSLRRFLARVSKSLFTPQVLFALKCAIALGIVFLVAVFHPEFYSYWNLTNSYIILLYAITPSLGQSNLSYLWNFPGSAFGDLWAYCALALWGAGVNSAGLCFGWGCSHDSWLPQLGLGVWVCLLVLPMAHLMLHSPIPSTGLFCLLAFSGNLNGYYYNRSKPSFDTPWIRFYKLMGGLTMAITFGLVFSMAIYPNLARRNLREHIASVLRLLNAHYIDVVGAAFHPDPRSGRAPLPAKTLARLTASRREIRAEIAGLEPLVKFAAAELRVEGPFQLSVYREVITGLSNMHDWLASATMSLGGQAFGLATKGLLTRRMRRARSEMQATVG
ncbi:hypothetical protein HK405_011835 [Cladochytrium tenue]|nr:hypothetical protein HK405_011835 [Cladochytrium tenue]